MICLLSNGNVKTFETHTCFNTLKKIFQCIFDIDETSNSYIDFFSKVQNFAKNVILMTGLMMNFFAIFPLTLLEKFFFIEKTFEK